MSHNRGVWRLLVVSRSGAASPFRKSPEWGTLGDACAYTWFLVSFSIWQITCSQTRSVQGISFCLVWHPTNTLLVLISVTVLFLFPVPFLQATTYTLGDLRHTPCFFVSFSIRQITWSQTRSVQGILFCLVWHPTNKLVLISVTVIFSFPVPFQQATTYPLGDLRQTPWLHIRCINLYAPVRRLNLSRAALGRVLASGTSNQRAVSFAFGEGGRNRVTLVVSIVFTSVC